MTVDWPGCAFYKDLLKVYPWPGRCWLCVIPRAGTGAREAPSIRCSAEPLALHHLCALLDGEDLRSLESRRGGVNSMICDSLSRKIPPVAFFSATDHNGVSRGEASRQFRPAGLLPLSEKFHLWLFSVQPITTGYHGEKCGGRCSPCLSPEGESPCLSRLCNRPQRGEVLPLLPGLACLFG